MTYSTLRSIALSLVAIVFFGGTAGAETLMMPKRDALRGVNMIVWGVTTLPNHTAASPTTFSINFGDGTANAVGNVTDRSYISTPHAFPAAGTYTVTLTVTNALSGPPEVATVEVRVVDPAAIGGPGTTTGAVGPGSNQTYRDVRINMAIEDGLRYLWTTQSSRTTNFPNGTMVSWGGQRQWTAFAITAFENHGYRLPADPLVAPTGIYEKYLVQKGLNFIMNGLSIVTLNNQLTSSVAGQPAPRNACVGAGIEAPPCIGVTDTSNNPGYTIGIAMMPLAASSALNRVNGLFGPTFIRGKTYKEILQRMANTLSHGQIDINAPDRGGWGYGMNTSTLDGSVMGWAILGLLDAQAATIAVPDWVKTELAFGITGAWNTNGSFDYDADGNPAGHVYTGMDKAGISLQGRFMTGEIGGLRVNATRDYISARWNTAGRLAPDSAYWNCGSHNNRGCSYSMFNNFKGLQLQGISTLPGVGRAAGPGIIPANDWHADYEDWFVNNQVNPTLAAGGHWNMTFSGFANDTNANVAIAELILSGVALVLPDADKFATVGLSPATATAVEGGTHTIVAKAESAEGAAVAGANVTFQIISGPNAGLTFNGVTNAAGEVSWTYTDAGPIPSYGTDRIRASIGTLNSNIAAMIWTPFNRPPVANPDAYDVNEDGTLNGDVVANDTDPDSDELNAFVESDVSHGALALSSSGGFQYLPAPNYCGPDSFTYSVNDGMYDSDPVTVTINVVCVNDAPVANDAAVATDEDTAVGGQVTSSDVDGPSATYSLDSGAANGTAVVNGDGTFTYTPNANFCGSDAFTFSVTDGTASDAATVNVTVNCVNDAPVADDASATTNEDTAVSGALSSSDPDGPSATYSLDGGASNGTAAVNADGSFSYTPNVNFCGSDAFTFSVSDGTASDGGTVNITVTCVNDAPIAHDGAASTDEDTAVSGTLSSSDTDGPSATYSLDGGASNGTAIVNPDGSFTYTPNPNFCGSDSFSFAVSDGTASDTAAVSVTVSCVNDAPVANDSSVTTAEDTPLPGTVTSSDVDGPAAIYAVASGPSNGTVTVNPDGSYVYTPNANYFGPDSFTFTVNDGSDGTDTGAVSINVTAVNDVPFCQAAGPSVASLWPPNHELVNIDVLGVTDPVEGSAITITVTGIFQDEPTNTIGDGNTLIDGFGLGTPTAQVRRERSGSKRVPGDGRMYYIYFTGTDAEGGECKGVVQVGVPHDLGQDHVIGAGGPLYKSTGQ